MYICLNMFYYYVKKYVMSYVRFDEYLKDK